MSDVAPSEQPPNDAPKSSAAGSSCAGCVETLESFARALRLEMVIIDAYDRPRVAGDAGCFASPATVAALARRLGPAAREQGVAVAHADLRSVDGTEVCAFPVLDGLAMVATGPARARAPSLAGLRQLYGLTLAEARVARALASSDEGHSPKSIADTLGVAISTVRTQLRQIQAKCHAESQTDLVRRLLTSAAVLMGH